MSKLGVKSSLLALAALLGFGRDKERQGNGLPAKPVNQHRFERCGTKPGELSRKLENYTKKNVKVLDFWRAGDGYNFKLMEKR